jgi:hypothetical protein
MQKTFETPIPTSVYVELVSGDLTVDTVEPDHTVGSGGTATTTVEVTGDRAEDVTVELRDDRVVVIAPRGTGFLRRSPHLDIHVTLPHDSGLDAQLGSADAVVTGRVGEVNLRTGSGDLEISSASGPVLVESGSGDVTLGEVAGELRVKTGSGDVTVGSLGAPGAIATGSGDVVVRSAAQPLQLKTGSGDLTVEDAREDLALSSASGDHDVRRLHRGRVQSTSASGTIRLGVPAGVPVWTDIRTVSGSVRSDLGGAGRPEPGQDHLELRASTVSGDVVLQQL